MYPVTGVALLTDAPVGATALKNEPDVPRGFPVFAMFILPLPVPILA